MVALPNRATLSVVETGGAGVDAAVVPGLAALAVEVAAVATELLGAVDGAVLGALDAAALVAVEATVPFVALPFRLATGFTFIGSKVFASASLAEAICTGMK